MSITALGVTRKINTYHRVTSPQLYRNNCLIHAIFDSHEDCGLIRKHLSHNIANVISKKLNCSDEEEKLLTLHHLDLNYGLGLTNDLEHYFESNSKTRIEKKVILATQKQINNGAMLDMVFATQALSDMSGKDITVNFDHGNIPMKYVVESTSPGSFRQHVQIKLENEHFSRKSTNNLVRNYVIIPDNSFFIVKQIYVSIIDFMVFNLSTRILSLLKNCLTLHRYQQAAIENVQPRRRSIRHHTGRDTISHQQSVAENSEEPSWQSIRNHPERDMIAKKFGYNDFYTMATSQNRANEAKKNATSSQNLVQFIKNKGNEKVNVEKMNNKILSFVQVNQSSTYTHNKIRIDFARVEDLLSGDPLIEEGKVDSSKWCAIKNGVTNDGVIIYQLVTKEFLVKNLESGNKNNPFTNQELKEDDVLIGLEFEKWLDNAKQVI